MPQPSSPARAYTLPAGDGYTIRGPQRVRLIAVTYPVREAASGGWGGFISDLELGQGQLISPPGAQ